MQTKDLYYKYNLMPQLAKHQLRVAGVAKLITDSWDDRIAADKAVRACLLHDMGNLAKFKGLDEYWQGEQKKFWEKYGDEAHLATYAILSELGLNDYVEILKELAAYYGPITGKKPFAEYDKSTLLVLYSDLRVAMTGVVSMYERIKDLVSRYPNTSRPETEWGDELERYVQVSTSANVKNITEKSVEPLFADLLALEWDVK